MATGDAASLGARIGPRLGEVLTDSPHVGDIRGIGMMSAVEFVRDREAPTSSRRSERITEKPWQALFDQGVILYKSIAMAGTDGLIVAPSLVITEDEIDLTVEKLGAARHRVLSASAGRRGIRHHPESKRGACSSE